MTGRYIRYKYKSCFIKNVLFGRDRHRWTQTEYFTVGQGWAGQGCMSDSALRSAWRREGSEMQCRTPTLPCTTANQLDFSQSERLEFNQEFPEKEKLFWREN